jgi:hypothetical protein
MLWYLLAKKERSSFFFLVTHDEKIIISANKIIDILLNKFKLANFVNNNFGKYT